MRMRWMFSRTRKDRVRNEYIERKAQELNRGNDDREAIEIVWACAAESSWGSSKERGYNFIKAARKRWIRSKTTWMKVVRKDMESLKDDRDSP